MAPVILILDDEPDLGALLSTAFAEEFEVVVARDAAEALVVTEQRTPAIVLLDLRMPGAGMDGFDFVYRYQAVAGSRAAPIVVISALPRHQQAVLESRVAGFMPKPFAIAQLTDFVKRVLSPEADS